MKNITLIIGGLCLVVNLLFGLVISVYSYVAMGLNCGVILATTLLVYAVQCMQLKDAFKVSLTMLYILGGFNAFIMGFYSIPQLEDNWVVIADLVLLLLGVVLLVVANLISKVVK